MIPLVGLGAGGHARVLLEILTAEGRYEIIGLLDPNPELHGKSTDGVPVLGGDEMLAALTARGVLHAFMGIGSSSDTRPRQRIFEQAKAAGLQFVAILHPSAVLAPSAEIGEGCAILAGAVVGTGARLADNVIVNTRAVVDHDCRIESHAHIASGAVLAGNVQVGEGAHIGAGAVIRQGLRIGRRAVIGVGAAVVCDVPDEAVFGGVPARPLIR
jgi:sugar O-acyltransferase (sialic acid O-acetyltransferase NeuD family)